MKTETEILDAIHAIEDAIESALVAVVAGQATGASVKNLMDAHLLKAALKWAAAVPGTFPAEIDAMAILDDCQKAGAGSTMLGRRPKTK